MSLARVRARGSLVSWLRCSIMVGSRETNASVYVAPQPSAPVDFLGAPLALAVSLDKIPRSAGGASLSPSFTAAFLKRIGYGPDCWNWLGAINHYGYGVLAEGKRQYQAHRISYGHFVGPIPDGHEIDHLCRNRRCVRPEHLEAVTKSENILRQRASVTHCPRGHAYAEHSYQSTVGKRRCRLCRAIREGYIPRAAAPGGVTLA